jgi:hypothetical protein
VFSTVRSLPWGIAAFLVYAFLILAGIGLSLPTVINLAIDAPVSIVGLVAMALLAYTIFTITLVFQRKAPARGFALGLSTLTLPLIPLGLLGGYPIVALLFGLLAAILFRGLRAPAVASWLDQL